MKPEILRNLIVLAAAKLGNSPISDKPLPASAIAALWSHIAEAETYLAEISKPVDGPGSEQRAEAAK